MALLAKTTKKKPKPKKPSPELKEQRRRERSFTKQNRDIFLSAGFELVPGVDGKHFDFEGIQSELDDIFIYENVIVFAEYTLSNTSNLGTHAKGKAGSHNKIIGEPVQFIQELSELCPALNEKITSSSYTHKQLIFAIIYASEASVDNHHQAFFEKTKFISRSERAYFKKLTKTLKKSSRYELFDFLGINISKVGANGITAGASKIDRYHGSLLPEEHSNFPKGFKVASFYVDPEALLKRAYVLRQGGWKDSLNLYQRMIIPAKISAIRKYLREHHRVFANNIVITLPDNTEFRDNKNVIIDTAKLAESTPAWVHIAEAPNSVGIVDGQHRVFSYYEDLSPDVLIDKYRKQQNLLATGIVYPPGTTAADKEKFEAALFLEINSNQSGAKSDLKQAIWLILDPFKPVSVARTVVNRLASTLPLNGFIQRTDYDIEKIPTTTIVSYGIQPLVKRSGNDSVFTIWNNPGKSGISDGNRDDKILEEYIKFSSEHIADFFTLIRNSLDKDKWNPVDKNGNGILSVTTINSFAILMRRLIESGKITHKEIKVDLSPINKVKFKSFKSSQYAALATEMYKTIK